MYIPVHFTQNDRNACLALLAAYPLGSVVASTPDGLEANHLPLLWQPGATEFGRLHWHLPRANPLWQHADGQAVLVMFAGADGYISPNWYPSKHEHGKAVPTWNYTAVHVRGRLRVIDDAAWLHTHLAALTTQHESGLADPWRLEDAPTDYIARLQQALVGIEIVIDEMQGKSKLSQNRSRADRDSVIAALRLQGQHHLAEAMAALLGQPT